MFDAVSKLSSIIEKSRLASLTFLLLDMEIGLVWLVEAIKPTNEPFIIYHVPMQCHQQGFNL
jgi:hypothetical protein